MIGQNVNAYHGARRRTARTVDARPTAAPPCATCPASRGCATRPAIRATCDDDLIAAHRDLPALMPYVHLPVQSGSDRILAAMNRKHTRADYLAPIERLRAARADIAFTSDFIVGFPGETEQDFRDTLALVEEVNFATAYSFKYSPRPGHAGRRDGRSGAGSREDRAPATAAGRRSPGNGGRSTPRLSAEPWMCWSKSPASSLGN